MGHNLKYVRYFLFYSVGFVIVSDKVSITPSGKMACFSCFIPFTLKQNAELVIFNVYLLTWLCKKLLGRPCTVVTGGLIKCS